MALKDWKPFENYKRAYKSKSGKIVSIGKLPKKSPFNYVVYTQQTVKKFKSLSGAEKRQKDYMKNNK